MASPVTAGPAAAAGMATPPRSPPAAVNALSAAANTEMIVAMIVAGKSLAPASTNSNATSITRMWSRCTAVAEDSRPTFTAPIVGWISRPGPLVSIAVRAEAA